MAASKQKCIVTITDGISPTSMPFNEFMLYRLENCPDEKQVFIQVFEKGVDKNVKMPESVDFYSLGMNLSSIWNTVKKIEEQYDVKAYHIHEGKSVILFSVATLLTRRGKTIYTLHSTYKNYPFHNKLFSFCASLLAKKVVCVSDTSYKYYPKTLKVLRGKNAMSIQNGVDTDRIDAVDNSNLPVNEMFTMMYVARLVPLKRHYILFDALTELQNVKLVLIGQGPLKDELVALAKEKGIENQVEFRGLLPREEVYRSLMEADLYVSTSSYEGLPIGVLEAMGCGTACLVTNIEQHEEIAVKCPSLMTLPPDARLWVKKIKELQSLSKKELVAIGTENKKQVYEKFSLKRMHENYNKLYERK